MSNQEITKTLSASAALLATCLSSVSVSASPLPSDFLLPKSYNIQQNRKNIPEARRLITEMSAVIKLQVAAVFLFDYMYKDLKNNDQDLLRKLSNDKDLIDLVQALPNDIKHFKEMLKDLDEHESTLMDIVIAGHINLRNKANILLKTVKQMTFIPAEFSSELTDDDLLGIAEHARQISKAYS